MPARWSVLAWSRANDFERHFELDAVVILPALSTAMSCSMTAPADADVIDAYPAPAGPLRRRLVQMGLVPDESDHLHTSWG